MMSPMQVNMRKRERTREQAAELRQMQKLFLLKAMANPGQPVPIIITITLTIMEMAELFLNVELPPGGRAAGLGRVWCEAGQQDEAGQ